MNDELELKGIEFWNRGGGNGGAGGRFSGRGRDGWAGVLGMVVILSNSNRLKLVILLYQRPLKVYLFQRPVLGKISFQPIQPSTCTHMTNQSYVQRRWRHAKARFMRRHAKVTLEVKQRRSKNKTNNFKMNLCPDIKETSS
nr:hypothetical protein [Tanacetum cinerariifolium]